MSGSDNHHKKSGNGCLKGLLITVGVFVGAFLLLWWISTLSKPPGRSYDERIVLAPPGTLSASQTASLPIVVCRGETTVAYIIPPGKSVLMPMLDRKFWFGPDTDAGTLRVCDANNLKHCSSTEQGLRGHFEHLLVTNVSSVEIPFFCAYR